VKSLPKYIDHTVLKPEATPADIAKLVDEAVAHGFYAICVNPVYVSLAKKLLREKVRLCGGDGGGTLMEYNTSSDFYLLNYQSMGRYLADMATTTTTTLLSAL